MKRMLVAAAAAGLAGAAPWAAWVGFGASPPAGFASLAGFDSGGAVPPQAATITPMPPTAAADARRNRRRRLSVDRACTIPTSVRMAWMCVNPVRVWASLPSLDVQVY